MCKQTVGEDSGIQMPSKIEVRYTTSTCSSSHGALVPVVGTQLARTTPPLPKAANIQTFKAPAVSPPAILSSKPRPLYLDQRKFLEIPWFEVKSRSQYIPIHASFRFSLYFMSLRHFISYSAVLLSLKYKCQHLYVLSPNLEIQPKKSTWNRDLETNRQCCVVWSAICGRLVWLAYHSI